MMLCMAHSLSTMAAGQQRGFELLFTGVVADKLKPEMQVIMWSPFGPSDASKQNVVKEFLVADFPKRLDWNTFRNRRWVVEFKESDRLLFSVELSNDLFDRPRKIQVKLDPPTPHISPRFMGPSDIRYTGNITQRMEYRDFPRIDSVSKKLISPAVPRMKIVVARTGKLLNTQIMETGCMGYSWWAKFPSKHPPNGTQLRFIVDYDSGGLFPKIESERDFTFFKSMHGR